MAKATVKETTKVTEEVLKDENLEGAVTEADSEVAENTDNGDKAPKDEAGEAVTIPRFLFTADTESTHHEVCVNGKIYQVKYDEPVEVPKGVADVIKNAIEQKKKVKALINSLNGNAKEIQG